MDGMNQNNNNYPYGQQNDSHQSGNSYQQNNAQQVNDPYQHNPYQQQSDSSQQQNDPYQHNPYQQQNDPYQQQSDLYQPLNGFGGQVVHPYKPRGQKRGISTKIIIGVACTFATLVIIGGGLLAYYMSTPLYKITKGMQNLAEEMIDLQNPLLEKAGADDIMEMMQQDGSHVKTKLNLTPEGGFTLGIDTDFNKDMHAKELSLDTAVSMMNVELVHFNVYADDEKLCFSLPELYLENLYIENENVVSQYNNSMWGDIVPLDTEDYSIDLFSGADERISIKDWRNMTKTWGRFEDDIDACVDAMTVEKVEKGLYRVTFPAKEYDRLFKDLIKYYDEVLGTGYNSRQPDTGVLTEVFGEYKKLISSDVVLLFEINGKNRIESIMLEKPVKMLDDGASLDGELFFLGEKRSSDMVQGKISINGLDGTTREVIWQVQQTLANNTYQVDMDLKLTEGKETVGKLKYVEKSDAAKDEFDMMFSFKDAWDDIELIVEGSLDDIVKGESVEIDLDKVVLTMDDEDLFKLTGSINIEPQTKPVTSKVKAETAFFDMTESDWWDIISKVVGDFGLLSDDLYDLLDDMLW